MWKKVGFCAQCSPSIEQPTQGFMWPWKAVGSGAAGRQRTDSLSDSTTSNNKLLQRNDLQHSAIKTDD